MNDADTMRDADERAQLLHRAYQLPSGADRVAAIDAVSSAIRQSGPPEALAGALLDVALAELRRGDATRSREALAAAHHEISSRGIGGEIACGWYGIEFEVLARTDDLDQALRRLAVEFPDCLLDGDEPRDRFTFLLGVCAGLSAHPHRFPEPVSGLPAELASVGTAGDLWGWVLEHVQQSARELDSQHGGTSYADRVAAAVTSEVVEGFTDAGAEPRGADADDDGVRADHLPGDSADDADPLALWRAAEILAEGDPRRIDAYAAAAQAATGAGWTDDAGLAWAESARAAQVAGQDRAAHAAYAQAVRLLLAGEAPIDLLSRVLEAWAPVAVQQGDVDGIIGILDRQIIEQGGASGRIFEDSEVGVRTVDPNHPDVPTSDLPTACMQDSLARIIAEAPDLCTRHSFTAQDALVLAQLAAEGFEIAGDLHGAAHAGWLLARLQRDTVPTRVAVETYRAVMAAFLATGESAARAAAGGELVELLEKLDETDAAEGVARELARDAAQ